MASRQAEEPERNDSQAQRKGQQDQQRLGMIVSLLGAVHGAYKHAKEAVGGKSPESAAPANAVAAGEAKDEEATADSSSEGDEVSGEVTDAKGYKADVTRRATGLLADKKVEAKRRASEIAEAAAQMRGRENEVEKYERKKAEGLILKASEYEEENARMAEMAKDYEVARCGRRRRSAVGSLTGALKEKLTHPTDIVRVTRAAREHGGARRKDPTRTTKEVVVVDDKIKETLPAALKASVRVRETTTADDPEKRVCSEASVLSNLIEASLQEE